jgi:hypothetical protein
LKRVESFQIVPVLGIERVEMPSETAIQPQPVLTLGEKTARGRMGSGREAIPSASPLHVRARPSAPSRPNTSRFFLSRCNRHEIPFPSLCRRLADARRGRIRRDRNCAGARMKAPEISSVVQLRVQRSGINRAQRIAESLYVPMKRHIKPMSLVRFYRPVFVEIGRDIA